MSHFDIVMLSVIMLSVARLSVVAPKPQNRATCQSNNQEQGQGKVEAIEENAEVSFTSNMHHFNRRRKIFYCSKMVHPNDERSVAYR